MSNENINLDRFKFRVWDEDIEEYLEEDEDCFGYFTLTGEFHGGYEKYNGLYHENIYSDNYIIEQTTGWEILNKNDEKQLLFQGYIIHVFDSQGCEIRHLIDWCSVRDCFIGLKIPIDPINNGFHVTKKWLEELNFKIIGNKFENPELLEG